MELTEEKIKDALTYYLWHLRLDLKMGRMEFLRDNADKICAMVNGYTTKKGRGTADYEKYKLSCYASKKAINALKAGKWSPKGKALRQEHVIPLNIVGEILIKEKVINMSDCKLISRLLDLVIPCVITEKEDKELEKNKMPPDWDHRDAWARYKAMGKKSKVPLYPEIYALQKKLPFKNSTLPLCENPGMPTGFAQMQNNASGKKYLHLVSSKLPSKAILNQAKSIGLQGLYSDWP